MISSAPLTLGYDLTDDNVTERVWPIIANQEAIAINQAWAGHPGKMLRNLTSGQPSFPTASGCGGYSCDTQLWVKPLSKQNGSVASVAVLLLSNSDPDPQEQKIKNTSYTIELEWLGMKGAKGAHVRDVWAHKDLGMSASSFTTDSFGGHDSRLYVITPVGPLSSSPAPSPPPAQSCEASCLHGPAFAHPRLELGHCCIGTNSSGSMPSCAMGCLIAEHTQSLEQCENTCMAAAHQCSFQSAETGNQTLNMCANCYQGPGQNCGALFGVNDSTCTVQRFEKWAPHRGCGDYGGNLAAQCKQGCLFSFGCPSAL